MYNPVSPYAEPTLESPYLEQYLAPALLPFIQELSPARILDIGCGNGKLCSLLARQTDSYVVGIDRDEVGIELAREAYPSIAFYQKSLDSDPLELLDSVGEKFDLVVSTEVIEHLYSPSQMVRFASEVLNPSGKILVTTPYHGYLKNLCLSLANKWDRHLNPLWEGGHIKFWSKRTITQLFEEGNFELCSFKGVGRCRYLWMSMILLFHRQ